MDDLLRAPGRDLDPAWFDYNGHLNMAYYNVLFDKAVDHLFDHLGCGPAYRQTRNLSFFTAEIHVCYVRELRLGSRVQASLQLLDHDEKRLHVFERLHHADGWLAATSESMLLHIDMTGPKVVPMPADIFATVNKLAGAHNSLPWPEQAGRSIAIARKTGTSR